MHNLLIADVLQMNIRDIFNLTMKNQNSRRIILDLCGGTGAWSNPYKDAGYDVRIITLPKYDILDPKVIDMCVALDPYGILAAPPCTMFSMARTVAKTPRDMKKAMKIVLACMEVIWRCQYGGKRLQFWALENPKARLRWFLGISQLSMNPYEYGDRVRKPTDIWGNYNLPKKAPVELTKEEKTKFGAHVEKLPTLPIGYKFGDANSRAARRAITSPKWALAFFKANK